MEANTENEKKTYECAVCLKNYSAKKTLKFHMTQSNHKISYDVPTFLKSYLPENHRINHISSKKTTENAFLAKIVLPDVSDISSIHQWIDEFSKHNRCAYSRRMVCRQTKSPKMLLREVYFCYHYGPEMGTGRKKKLKGTNCQSKITVALKNGSPNFTTVSINFDHNHPLESEKLKINNHFTNMKDVFVDMFENGASVAEALKYYQIHVQTQLLNGVARSQNSLGDKLQDYDWIRHLFQKTYETKYSSNKVTQLTDTIKNHIDNINKEYGTPICIFKETANGFVIVIVTSLMERAYESCHINELFIDSIGNLNIYGLKVFLLMTRVENIPLPVGVIISSSDSSEVLSLGFLMYLNFGNVLKNAPSLVITDDNPEMIEAFKLALPNTKFLSCPIYFLRSCHQWLVKQENDIFDRNELYDKLHQIVYAEEETSLYNLFAELKDNINLRKKILKYIDSLYATREQWALCYQKNSAVRDTSHIFFEHHVRLLKNDLHCRMKMQSLQQLINFIICDFCDTFVLLCINHGLHPELNVQLDEYDVTQKSHNVFILFNVEKNIFYEVNTCTGTCTCSTGCMGAYCKHQQVLTHTNKNNQPLQQEKSKNLQVLLNYVISGEIDMPSESSKPLDISQNQHESNIEIIEVRGDISVAEDQDIEIVNNVQINEEIFQSNIQDQLEEFKHHISDICEKVQSHPVFFLKALADFNKHLDIIKKNPAAILKTMTSINSEYVLDSQDPNPFLVSAVSPTIENSIFEIEYEVEKNFDDQLYTLRKV